MNKCPHNDGGCCYAPHGSVRNERVQDGACLGYAKCALYNGLNKDSDMLEVQVPDPDKHRVRKEQPVFSGVLKYFPDAIKAVANCSFIANEQHNPGEEMHWNRAKSADEHDSLVRHLMDAGSIDDDGVRHSTKVAWRALAMLQKELEQAQGE